MNWSKNVREERNCPDQFLLGSWDAVWCFLLGQAIYLEIYLFEFPTANYLFTESMDRKAPANLIARYRVGRSCVVMTARIGAHDKLKQIQEILYTSTACLADRTHFFY